MSYAARSVHLATVVCLLVALTPGTVSAQQDPAAGIKPFSTHVGSTFDSVDLASSNVVLIIPVRKKDGKAPFSYNLVFNSRVSSTIGGGRWHQVPLLNYEPQMQVEYSSQNALCYDNNGVPYNYSVFQNFAITDWTTAMHPMPSDFSADNQPLACGNGPRGAGPTPTADGSGYTMLVSIDSSGNPQITAYDRSGNLLGCRICVSGNSFLLQDPDGSQITQTAGTYSNPTYSDPLGTTVLAVNNSGSPTQPTVFQWTDVKGSTQSVQINYTPFTLQTAFGCPNIQEENDSYPLPTSITTPSGNFTISYEPTPGNPANITGRIANVTFPVGGSVSYTYSGGNNGINCNSDVVPTLTRQVNDNNGNVQTWTYTSTRNLFGDSDYTVTETDPGGNQTVYHFTAGSFQSEKQVYQGTATGTPLVTTVTCYNGFFTNCPATGGGMYLPITQTDVFTYLNGSTVASLVETKFNTYGLVTETKRYDFGAANALPPSGPPSGTPVVDKTISYGSWNGSTCAPLSNYLYDRPCLVTMKDSSGITVAQTRYTYNSTGHPTQISKLVSGSTYVTSSASYNTNGTLASSTDARDAKTTYAYGACNGFALTLVTLPVTGLSTSQTWDCNGGVITSVTDANSNRTNYSYTNPANGAGDPYWRLTQTTYPDGGKFTTTYNDTARPVNITANQLMDNSGHSITTQTNFDGLGRPISKVLTSDPNCPAGIHTDTTYDALGRIHTVSNPYCTTSEATYGITTYTYDPLGRVTQIRHPDSTSVLTTYSGRATQVQDEGNGTQRVTRISQTDALGRLTSVCELSGSTLIGSGGTPSACGQDIAGTGFLTTYQYDALNNLTQVTQSGLNLRTFAYDSLSRVTSATNPESGQICYGTVSGGACQANGYDANGNLVIKTDARGISTTYSYDALNRLTGKTYSDSTPAVTFSYDQTSALGVALTNTKGRKSSESTAGSSPTGAVFSYDSMGRVSDNSQCTPLNCGVAVFAFQYPQYDFAGDLLAATNAAGVTMNYSYDTAARLTTMTTNFVDGSHPGTLFSNAVYGPVGLTSVTLGNGTTESLTYTNRLWLQSLAAQSGSTTFYSFSIGSFAPNGDILAANDSANNNWVYAYDAFNRLICSNLASNGTCAAPTNGTPTYKYEYDRFGNRWHQNGPQSSQLGFDANNRITGVTGVSYGASGNLTGDGFGAGSHTYFYDAENRIIQVDGTLGNCSTATACYVYDAEGRRVRKTTSSGSVDYLYDLQGHQVAEVDATGVFNRGELYAANRHLATYTSGPNGTTYFIHSDWLGTERARTNMTGAACETIASLPFGDGQTVTSTCPEGDVSPMHFTGKQRDSESGLDNFGARYNSSNMGRFMSPDWSDTPSAVPYSDLHDPQSLNLYAYVRNNPLSHADLDGHEDNKPGNAASPAGNAGGCSGGQDQAAACKPGENAAPQQQAQKPALTVSLVQGQTALGAPVAEAAAGFTVSIQSSSNFPPGNLTVTADLHFDADKKVAKGTEVLLGAAAENAQAKVGGQEAPKTVNSLLVDVRPYNQSGSFGGKPQEPGYIRFTTTDSQGHKQTARLNVTVVSKRLPGRLPLPAGDFNQRLTVPIPNP